MDILDKVDVVRTLLDHNANVEVRNRVGYTPLILAAFFCHLETCKVLIEKGKAEIGKRFHLLFQIAPHNIVMPFIL